MPLAMPGRFAPPRLKSTSVTHETFAGVTYQIEGELVPALAIELGQVPVYFEHHVLLWKEPGVRIGTMPLAGALRRMMAGLQVVVAKADGPGMIAFSRDGAGHIMALHLDQGQDIDVREHQFLAATGNIDYSFQRVRGIANMLFGGTGFFIDTFAAHRGSGILWLHGFGNIFEKVLGPGESIDVEPGAWVYKDRSVTMETNLQNLPTGVFASAALTLNRFTGPRRIGLQSMSMHLPTET